MGVKVMKSEEVRVGWRDVLDMVSHDVDVVVERYNKPVAAVIAYEDYIALQEQLEGLRDIRDADIAYAEYLRDPSSATKLEDLKKELLAEDDE